MFGAQSKYPSNSSNDDVAADHTQVKHTPHTHSPKRFLQVVVLSSLISSTFLSIISKPVLKISSFIPQQSEKDKIKSEKCSHGTNHFVYRTS